MHRAKGRPNNECEWKHDNLRCLYYGFVATKIWLTSLLMEEHRDTLLRLTSSCL